MKNKLIFLLFLIVAGCTSFESKENIVITGETSWQEWKFKSNWDLKEYYSYNPDLKLLNLFKTKNQTKQLSYIIFASSFCDECRQELPKIFKIFEMAEIYQKNIRLIGLDHDVSEPTGEYKKYDIKNLPKVIFFNDGKQIGEITSAGKDWMEQFSKIIN